MIVDIFIVLIYGVGYKISGIGDGKRFMSRYYCRIELGFLFF